VYHRTITMVLLSTIFDITDQKIDFIFIQMSNNELKKIYKMINFAITNK
jgi:hypothetical protein